MPADAAAAQPITLRVIRLQRPTAGVPALSDAWSSGVTSSSGVPGGGAQLAELAALASAAGSCAGASPGVALPRGFGSIYRWQEFRCCIVAINSGVRGSAPALSGVELSAELQIGEGGAAVREPLLDVRQAGPGSAARHGRAASLPAGSSVDLSVSHTVAQASQCSLRVTVKWTGGDVGGAPSVFRKFYKFPVLEPLAVTPVLAHPVHPGVALRAMADRLAGPANPAAPAAGAAAAAAAAAGTPRGTPADKAAGREAAEGCLLPAEASSGRLVMLRLSLRNLTSATLALVGEPQFAPTAQVRGARILSELASGGESGPACGRLRGTRLLEPGEELGVLVALWQAEGWRPTQDSVPVGELRVKWRGGGGEPAAWTSPTVLVMAKHLLRPSAPKHAAVVVHCAAAVAPAGGGAAATDALTVGDRVRVLLSLSAPAGTLPANQPLSLAPSADWLMGAPVSPASDALAPGAAAAAARSADDGSLSAEVSVGAVCSRPGSWALVPAKALVARVGHLAVALRGRPAHTLVLG
mmetsp:Transcript_21524/g.81928  ORF Transcript_21524/g.81928 Transcript_21524/m.81928 type:complete len:526 (-) Transcript_21524:1825-3402(-)